MGCGGGDSRDPEKPQGKCQDRRGVKGQAAGQRVVGKGQCVEGDFAETGRSQVLLSGRCMGEN